MNPSKGSLAAVVLAGGLSRRMGGCKPLALLHGRPLLDHVLAALDACDRVAPIVVVTGHLADRVEHVLRGRAVTAVHNTDYADGEMLSSIQAGLRALPAGAEAVVLALCDQPMVKPKTIAAMADAWTAARPRILVPRYAGERGHPIILDRLGFAEIQSLDRGATLKTYITAHASEMIELDVDDSAIARDIDTPDDLAAEECRQL